MSHAHEKGGIGNSAYTTDKQVFHTDVGDLIALMALQSAAEGGTSRISSGGRVYNELAATRPDIIKTLSEPWPLDRYVDLPVTRHTTSLSHSAALALEEIQDTRLVRCFITRTDTRSFSTHAATSLAIFPRSVALISRLSQKHRRRLWMQCTFWQRNSRLG